MADKRDIPELKIKENFIGRIAKLFINKFQMTILIIILILALGISGAVFLPKESLPEINFATIFIQTTYPGASPEDVEALVTDPIENKLGGIDNVDEITSESNFGFSTVTVSFEDGVDIDRKKLEIDNKLSEITFPEGVLKSQTSAFNSSDIPLMEVTLAGNYTLFELTDIAKSIQAEIERIPGVDEVEIFGTLDKEIHVILNQTRMMAYGITTDQVRQGIQGLNVGLPVGEANLNGIRYNLRVDESFNNIEAIEMTMITTSTGENVFLRDIAEVIESSETVREYNRTFVRDLSTEIYPSLLISVKRQAGSDVVGTSDTIKRFFDSGRGIFFPEDLQVDVTNDLAVNVNNDLAKIQESAVSGLIVVIIVLFLFIGFRESMIVSISIPLSLLLTLGVLSVVGISLNTFAVLGLIVSLGLLVDNSIIAMENIDRVRKLGLEPRDAAVVGINQVGFPILAATLTTIAAFFPLAILPGIIGAFVNTIPRTIIITLVASFLVSVTIIPAIYQRIVKGEVRFENKIHEAYIKIIGVVLVAGLSFYAFSNEYNYLIAVVAAIFFGFVMTYKSFFTADGTIDDSRLMGAYSGFVSGILNSRKRTLLALLAGGVVFVASVALIPAGVVKIAFFPENEPTSVDIIVDTPGGTTLEETARVVDAVEAYLREETWVESFNSTIGGAELDRARISVVFSPKAERNSVSGFLLAEEVLDTITRIPGADIFVESVSSGGPPVGKPIGLELIGDDLEALNQVSKDYQAILSDIEGVYNIESTSEDGAPQILIDIQETKAQLLGLSVLDISNQLRAQIEGVEATILRDQREEVAVVLKYSETGLSDINAINALVIATRSGEMIPIRNVASIREVSGLNAIRHTNGERTITIEADLRQGYNVNDFQEIFDQETARYNMPAGVSLLYGGDVAGIQENFGILAQSMILAVFLVFIILTLQFDSILQPFAILLTVPMALVGVIVGLGLTGNEFGFYAFMGLVALVGIAVNDAIVLIDYMNYLRSNGMALKEAIVEAGITRFNPVLATTMTTIGGVLPLTFKEVYYEQFGFTLVFGLLVTTILTLVYIPIMYGIIEGYKLKKRGELNV